MEHFKILTVNPGSTTTKVSLYEDEREFGQKTLDHSSESLGQYKNALGQLDMRMAAILDYLAEMEVEPETLSAVACRGGPRGKYHAGAYRINDAMVAAAQRPDELHHPTCLSPLIGDRFARQYGLRAYVYDVVYVDELEEVARISGLPEISRIGASHTLNTKAVARRLARDMGQAYEEMTFIMCHMGGGIGVNLHKNGRIVDVTSNDEGTFAPVRCGRVPCDALVKLCYSGKYTLAEMRQVLNSRGGLIAYLDTNDCREVERRIREGDSYADLIFRAMAYQIAKDIGAMAAVAKGQVDAIILTGGIAHSQLFTGWIREMTEFIAPVIIFPGSIEEEALAHGVLRVLRGEETASEFIPGVTV